MLMDNIHYQKGAVKYQMPHNRQLRGKTSKIPLFLGAAASAGAATRLR